MSYIIRHADENDVPGIMNLIRELAAFEKAPEAVINTEENLLNDGFGKHPVYKALVAEMADTGEVVGMALYFVMYSTWKGRVLYLDDLMVTERYRNNGIGRRLMDEFLKEAQQMGVHQVRWHVLDWNTPAVEFYKTLGADFEPQWVTVKMDSAQMKNYLDK